MLDPATSMTALPARLFYAESPGTLIPTLRSKAKEKQQDELFSEVPSWKDSLYEAFVDEVPGEESEITSVKKRKRPSPYKEMDQMMSAFAVSHEF